MRAVGFIDAPRANGRYDKPPSVVNELYGVSMPP
jgi:hypothetical protein